MLHWGEGGPNHVKQERPSANDLGLFVNFTVESIVTLRAGVPNSITPATVLGSIKNEDSGPETVASSILYALGLDLLASIFNFAPPVRSPAFNTNGSASSMWAEWDPLATDSDLPIVLSGMASADGTYTQLRGMHAFDDLMPTPKRAIQNYAIGFHSAILVDVGSIVSLVTGQPDTNIFTNMTALHERIRIDDMVSTMMTPMSGSANGINITTPATPYVLNHTSEFRLPIAARRLMSYGDSAGNNKDPGPATLVQRYLCYSLVLKSPTTLVVDIMVATASMFMTAWGILHVVLTCIAREWAENGALFPCFLLDQPCIMRGGRKSLFVSVMRWELSPVFVYYTS
ncbi:hypothetical protein CTheo_5338 [Ceratobasidium theobromae]|uniref:Uncharacterized protein n=1 Tax=Ceratobasidium theobromae TaxID=1582974 RepID=A0A5N5QIC1_9AGAM|nr:hypothetical protein CTheo_5338 [Ceratobasidium theobromae]